MGEECDLFPTVQRKEAISEMTGSDVTKEECYTEPDAYMWRIDERKERVFTRGGLTDVGAKSPNGVKCAVRGQLQAIVLAMDCKGG